MILAGVFGLVIDATVGLLGAGGSVLAVPALVYGVGQPVAAALFGSLLVVAVSAAGGLVPRLRAGVIHWPVALVFAAAGVPTAFAGAAVARLLPDRWLLVAFAMLMVVAAYPRRSPPARGSGGLTGLFAGAALPASLAAGRVANRLPATVLRCGFAYLILAIAAGVAATALFAPAALNTG